MELDPTIKAIPIHLGKRKREVDVNLKQVADRDEDIVEAFFQRAACKNESSKRKRKRDTKSDSQALKDLFEKMSTFNPESQSCSLDLLNKYKHYFRKAKRIKNELHSLRDYHDQVEVKKIEEEWTLGGDVEAWEKRIFERSKNFISRDEEDRISKQFKLASSEKPDLRKRYLTELKAIYELFKKRSQDITIRPKILSRITKCASLFRG